jgi:ElaB/YqjD/DUF883 family membrane-anchored ribosome-binding protein
MTDYKDFSIQRTVAELGKLLDDIDQTFAQIKSTKSEKRKSQLRKRIEKKNLEIKQLTERNKNANRKN